MVEFVFIASLLFTMIFFAIEVGRLLFVMNTMSEATRRGARYAAVISCQDDMVEAEVNSFLGLVRGSFVSGHGGVSVQSDSPGSGTVSVGLVGYRFRFSFPLPGFSREISLPTQETVVPIEAGSACP